jgi:hypothetical protein
MFGATVKQQGKEARIQGGQRLHAIEAQIPGDPALRFSPCGRPVSGSGDERLLTSDQNAPSRPDEWGWYQPGNCTANCGAHPDEGRSLSGAVAGPRTHQLRNTSACDRSIYPVAEIRRPRVVSQRVGLNRCARDQLACLGGGRRRWTENRGEPRRGSSAITASQWLALR